MNTPCEKSVRKAINSIKASLKEMREDEEYSGIERYSIEQSDENPNSFTVATVDSQKHINIGIVGYDEDNKKVIYCCYDSVRGNHDAMEGVPEEDSKCWWKTEELKIFIMFLTGEVREIIRRNYAKSV